MNSNNSSSQSGKACPRPTNKGEQGIRLINKYILRIYDPTTKELVRQVEGTNTMPTQGLNFAQDILWLQSSPPANWFISPIQGVGDINVPTFAPGDTLAAPSDWVEVQDYSEGVRQTLSMGASAGGISSNSASTATITVNANGTTISGLMITENNVKGGTTGNLLSTVAVPAILVNSGTPVEMEFTSTLTAT